MRYQTPDEVVAHAGLMPDPAAAAARKQARRQRLQRTPLTTEQHILHLLLTVFTAGLWLPVWIIRAIDGNRPPGWWKN